MAHKDLPFLHERAKASLDSLVLEKWDDDEKEFLEDMRQHKEMPKKVFHLYVQQTTGGTSDCTRVDCSEDMTIYELKVKYYDERIKLRKKKAKSVVYKRAEREGKLNQLLLAEKGEKEKLGDAYVDQTDIVLPDELIQCSYEWGFLSIGDYESAEKQRETRVPPGKFVPKRCAITNVRYGGQFLKDFKALKEYNIPSGGNLIHTHFFPDLSLDETA